MTLIGARAANTMAAIDWQVVSAARATAPPRRQIQQVSVPDVKLKSQLSRGHCPSVIMYMRALTSLELA